MGYIINTFLQTFVVFSSFSYILAVNGIVTNSSLMRVLTNSIADNNNFNINVDMNMNLNTNSNTIRLGPVPNNFPVVGDEPYFDPLMPNNITALVGRSAYLGCRVKNWENKTKELKVSWIRHRDIHILTVGTYTYTSDQRFQAKYLTETDEWVLLIKWTQKRDEGIYECQISTQPIKSFWINLNIVVPTAQILGGPDLHVDKGSTINLTCAVHFSPEPPAYIFWYHYDESDSQKTDLRHWYWMREGKHWNASVGKVISYDSLRGGISVITEKGDITTSFLLIQHADISDSGNYTCSPSNADLASIRVHVLNGERPAAMQTGSAGLKNISINAIAISLLVNLFLMFFPIMNLCFLCVIR